MNKAMGAAALLKKIKIIVVKAFALLKDNDPLILASATAFFTTFSIAPIIVILFGLLSLIFKSGAIRQQLFDSIQSTLGQKPTHEIQHIVNNFISLESSGWITIGVFLFLLFVATTLLGIVRKAIHQVWNIRRKSTLKFKYDVKERLIGLFMLIFMGVLFLVSIVLDASVVAFQDIIPAINSTLIINLMLSIVIVTLWFTILFKILPEAHVHWRVALAGGVVTSVLFNLGKFILGLILKESRLESIFNASASITLILLFIFYSSLIMYFGAAFTHAYAEVTGRPIHAGKYADEYEERLIAEIKNKKTDLTALSEGNPDQNKNKNGTEAAAT